MVSQTKDMENEEANTESLLELVFRIKLVKIIKREGLLSLLDMLLASSNFTLLYNFFLNN